MIHVKTSNIIQISSKHLSANQIFPILTYSISFESSFTYQTPHVPQQSINTPTVYQFPPPLQFSYVSTMPPIYPSNFVHDPFPTTIATNAISLSSSHTFYDVPITTNITSQQLPSIFHTPQPLPPHTLHKATQQDTITVLIVN